MKTKPIESKREKFVRLAEARTNRIIETLQLLGNCSNTTVYEYTLDDVDKIFQAIELEMRETRKKFIGSDDKKNFKFKLG